MYAETLDIDEAVKPTGLKNLGRDKMEKYDRYLGVGIFTFMTICVIGSGILAMLGTPYERENVAPLIFIIASFLLGVTILFGVTISKYK